jgi:pyruvate dehydrogenase kinase 2/3/4
MAEIMIDLRRIVGIMTRLTEDKETGSSILEQSQELIMTFLKCRLMTQLLCDHVVDCMLHRERKPNGAISVEVNVQDLIVSAIVEARHLVEASFVGIVGEDLDDDDDEMDSVVEDPPEPPLVEVEMESLSSSSLPVTATLIRPWLQYALVELLKNSLAITMERNRRDNPHSPYWPIYVHVSETSTDITIQLMDQGGGFQRPLQSSSSQDWFEFASRHDKWDRLDDQQTYAMVRSPIRGLGVGLCLSRLHLRQFGGDLVLEDRPDLQEWTGSGASSSGVVLLQSGLTATLRLSKDMATLEAAIEPKSDEC